MTATLHALDEPNVFLGAYLAPFRPWLEREDVTEILINQPGEAWIEHGGAVHMERFALPDVDDRHIKRLAEQIARASHQGINREQPLLGATLPDGARVQFVAPSATRGHWAMAIRRHRMLDMPLDAYAGDGATPETPAPMPDRRADPVAFLRRMVRDRRTILVSGGTSSGKTTFLNALLAEVPAHERIVLVEDTPEIRLRAANGLGLVAVKGELGEARVTTDNLLQAALRLRPDRIVLGELRGVEAVSFLRAINTGHPGSFTTIHANSAAGALEQLALMVMQAGLGLGRADTIAYARSMIDVIVQLDRVGGRRRIADIHCVTSAASTTELLPPQQKGF
ncbi:P-type DNA transfer ATPase VirB11 [Sphingomonas nostoxanthinifaciens]|uniref:P-type DNA transfer ATPase VirB11 n=1 Tax=Sphingomonas nostoxanthinifaciens TaxID=2872652 RepID=UPI001CC203E0|nr:P-type DNA transfer ATPase VirB11 [Sphingomonas nostoxanthinifaciens]UAK23162.1 P-type DNA transfer ATPase VirB11 [Sphingomonas nostoxanthinifaciens]